MKVKFERTGGFANIPFRIELDTSVMTEGLAEKLLTLVNKIMPLKSNVSGAKPDMFSYTVLIDDNGLLTEIITNDGEMTSEFQEFVEFVLEQA